MTMTNEGFLNLMEAIMEQARKDAESNDAELAKEASEYIEKMKASFIN